MATDQNVHPNVGNPSAVDQSSPTWLHGRDRDKLELLWQDEKGECLSVSDTVYQKHMAY